MSSSKCSSAAAMDGSRSARRRALPAAVTIAAELPALPHCLWRSSSSSPWSSRGGIRDRPGYAILNHFLDGLLDEHIDIHEEPPRNSALIDKYPVLSQSCQITERLER